MPRHEPRTLSRRLGLRRLAAAQPDHVRATHRRTWALALMLVGAACEDDPARFPDADADASPDSATPDSATPDTAPAETDVAPPLTWVRTRGDTKADLATGVAVDPTGNIYFAAHQQAVGALFTDLVAYKFAPDGSETWRVTWGGPFQEKAFIVAWAGDAVLVGGLRHQSAALEDADMAVVALDPTDGHLLWEFTWGQGVGYEEVDGLVAHGDAIWVSGWTTSATTGYDAAVLRLTRAGTLDWVKTWGSPTWDQADGQMVVDDTNLYVCGRWGAANYLGGGKSMLAKLSKVDGAVVDQITWGESAVFNDALGMASDGTSLYVVGLTIVAEGGGQIFVRKFDKSLGLAWERLWGGTKGEGARALAVDDDGEIVVAGHTDSEGAGGNDVLMLRYAPDGTLRYAHTWGGALGDTVGGIALHGGIAYLAGETFSFSQGQNDALFLAVDARTGTFARAGVDADGAADEDRDRR